MTQDNTYLPRTRAFMRHSWPTDMLAEVMAVEREIDSTAARIAEFVTAVETAKDRRIARLEGVLEVARQIDKGTPAERLKWSLRHALGELDKGDETQ